MPILFLNGTIILVREAFKKKIAEKETLVHMGGRGVKKNPLFLTHQKGDIFLWREGSKSFCHMLHIQLCLSVSTQFVAIFYVPNSLVPFRLRGEEG